MKPKSHIFIFLILNFLVDITQTINYCTIEDCPPGKHIYCKYKGCKFSHICHSNTRMMTRDYAYRKAILDIHNELRNKIALGKDNRGGNSQASNMRALSYSTNLEELAVCWAKQCVADHDECRNLENYFVGQNMVENSSSDEDFKVDPDDIVYGIKLWYESEINLTDKYVINRFESGRYGHFTQLVWATTANVGCATVIFQDNHGITYRTFCNYGESGNLLDSPVYLRGKPCSNCKKAKCNERYKGLCGDIRKISRSASARKNPNTFFIILFYLFLISK